MIDEEFYIKKIVALFHDPPHKAYVVSKGRMLSQKGKECIILIGQSPKNKCKKSAHECDAFQLFADIFLGIFNQDILGQKYYKSWRKYYKSIKEADKLASAIDRYRISILYSSKYPIINVRSIKLKNVFWPQAELDLSKDNKNVIGVKIREYEKNLKNLLDCIWKNINDVANEAEKFSELYQALYLLYELLWIDKGLKLTPADTREPTHTIFDHLYATASISNIIKQGRRPRFKYSGYLLGIDVVGVNDFISKSRKVRDMWISSYLVSALLWYVIIYFVEKYGPDVVIFPSLRFNQFYAYYILNKLKERSGGCNSAISEIKKLITRYIFNNEDLDKLDIPSYPIMPGRVTLILPEDANEDESFVVQKLKEGWKNLLRALQLYVEETDKAEMKELGKVTCDYFPLMEDNPPIRIRVKKIEISGSDTPDKWRLYHDAYHKLVSEFKKAKAVRIYPESAIDLQKFMTSNRGYEICTSCGVLPAVIIGEKEKGIISKDERLCPICLTKRLLGFEPRLLKVLLLRKSEENKIRDLVREIVDQEREFFVPSDSWFTSIDLLKELKNRLSDASFEEEFKKRCSVQFSDNIGNIVSNWKFFNNLEDKESQNLIVKYSPEELWFNAERPECEKFLKEKGLKIPSPYIAIVRADGDYLGDLLEGKLTPYFSGLIDSNDYEDILQIRNKTNNFLKEYLIRSGGNEKIENKVKELLSSSNIDYFIQILNEAKIIVTPAWHVAISAALNRSLIKEIELVNEYNGFVIYAGGDDLLAFLPVSNVVDFILKSRRAFYGGYEIGNKGESSNSKPFCKLNEAEYPQLAVIGRSYSVIFGRYKDPLSRLIRMSYSILENGKERIHFEKNGEKYKKDVAIFVYQGSISYVPLFTNRIDVVKEMNNSKINIGEVLERALKKIYNKIDSGDFSKSLLYDYYNYKDLIKSANEDKYRRDIIKTWLSRNVKSKSLAKQCLDSLVEELLNLSKIKTIDCYSSDEENLEEGNVLTQVILTLKFLLGVA